jgi:hypothetical protein
VEREGKVHVVTNEKDADGEVCVFDSGENRESACC